MLPEQAARPSTEGFSSLARVVTIAIGVAVGYALIPADPQPAGAMRYPALALTSALLFVPTIEAMTYGIKSALKIRNTTLIGIVYWLLADLLQALFRIQATTEGIKTAFLATGLFAMAVSIGSSIRIFELPASIRRFARIELSDQTILLGAGISFVLGVFYYAYMANFSVSLIFTGLFERSRFEAPWARGSLGDANSFVEHLSYFGYLLPLFTAAMFARSSRYFNLKTILCAGMSTIFILFLAQGGGRTSIGAVLGSAILVGILLSRRKLMGFHIVTVFAVTFSVQVAMNYILINRNVGLSTFELDKVTFSTINVDDNFNRLSQTADLVPSFYPYSGLQFFYFAIVRPIPRVLWPEKPVDPGFDLADLLGERDTSFTISIIGEAYAGFGFPLVFVIGLLFGVLARWWEQTLAECTTSVSVMLYSIGAMALFGAERGFVNIVLLSYPILALWAAFVLLRFGRSFVILGRGTA